MINLNRLLGIFVVTTMGFLSQSLYANVVITSDGKVGTVVGTNTNTTTTPAKPSKEQIMLDRIAILEKAQNSTDPDILAMAEQVRTDIAKEKADAEERKNNPIWWWIKRSMPIFVVLGVLALVFWLLWYMMYYWVEVRSTKNKR